MDLVVPLLARFMTIYHAGQIFIVAIFFLMVSGTVVLNRALTGRWSPWGLISLPLVYNYVFLVGLMNYLFGVGLSIWALAAWVMLRDRAWPLRFLASTIFVVVLFLCHLSALGVYGLGLLSYELMRLWTDRDRSWLMRIVAFVGAGVPFLVAVPLMLASPTMELVGSISWESVGKLDGLIYAIQVYSDIVAFVLAGVTITAAVWAWRRRLLRIHMLGWFLLTVGIVVYLALPRVMFDTYMTDQRVPIAIIFMLIACASLELRIQMVRRAFIALLLAVISLRLGEVSINWSSLSDTTSEFRASIRRIAPGKKVFVAYADPQGGDDVHDLGLVHAACIAIIEKSALVTTAFTVVGKQILRVRPEYEDEVDTGDGTPPVISQLLVAVDDPPDNMPEFWGAWPEFDYLYLLFTEDDTPNPDTERLTLIAEGSRFQLYRIMRPKPEPNGATRPEPNGATKPEPNGTTE